MISSRVQRTLVKSPPELWAELSDPGSLARHLGELGDIRVTGLEPETEVRWEADDARGTVHIKPSAWGTKVTLSIAREVPEAAQPDPEPPQAPDAPEREPEERAPLVAAPPPAEQEEPEQTWAAPAAPPPPPVESVPPPDPVAADEPEALSSQRWEPADAEDVPFEEAPPPEPPTRRGFFARLLAGWRRSSPWEPESDGLDEPGIAPADDDPVAPADDVPEELSPRSAIEALQARFEVPRAQIEPEQGPALPPEPQSTAAHPPGPEPAAALPPGPEPAAAETEADEMLSVATPVEHHGAEAAGEGVAKPAASTAGGDIAAELRAAEEVAAEEVTALLTAMLDRLGAAHHRPFSRG